jgi:hypothetical protein
MYCITVAKLFRQIVGRCSPLSSRSRKDPRGPGNRRMVGCGRVILTTTRIPYARCYKESWAFLSHSPRRNDQILALCTYRVGCNSFCRCTCVGSMWVQLSPWVDLFLLRLVQVVVAGGLVIQSVRLGESPWQWTYSSMHWLSHKERIVPR